MAYNLLPLPYQDLRKFSFEPPSVGAHSYAPLLYVASMRKSCLYNFAQKRAEQKARYGGEIFPTNYPANSWGTPFIDFFQFDTRTDTRKGIIAIDLVRYSP